MKPRLTAVLALVLLNSTSVMAQSNNQNRDGQGQYDSRDDWARSEQERKERERADQNRKEEQRNEQNRYDQGRYDQGRYDQGRYDQGRNEQGRYDQDRRDSAGNQDRRYNPGSRQATPRWSRGDHLPDRYRQKQYVVSDWWGHNLRKPPRGHQWVIIDNRNYFLVVIRNGNIAESFYRDDRDHHWRQRYSRRYTYNDDVYYQECRNSPDPAGVIVGALIGGLLGNTVGQGGGRTGATFAGVILGGALGAALTRDFDCEDRSYAYRTYYDGFNSGRPNSRHKWRNPRNDHRGEFIVGDYYDDPYGFRCAEFTQIAYIGGRPEEVRGRACRQPDGAWAIVN